MLVKLKTVALVPQGQKEASPAEALGKRAEVQVPVYPVLPLPKYLPRMRRRSRLRPHARKLAEVLRLACPLQGAR